MTITNYFLISLAFFSFIAQPVYSSDYSISGILLEEETLQPIPFATAAVYQQSDSAFVKGVITDDNGQFTISINTPSVYYLEISVLGFGKHYISDVSLDEANPHHDLETIILRQQVLSHEGIEVIGERSAITHQVDRTEVDLQDLGVSENASLPEALQVLPSIETDYEGNVSLRGSSNFQVLIDGKLTILSPREALSQYTVAQIESIEIITNPSARYQANSTSGIINIILKKGEGLGFSGFLSQGSSIGVDHFQPYNFGTVLSYRREKYNLTGAFNITDRRQEYDFTTEQRRRNGTDLDIISTNNVPWLRGGASLDFDYYLTDRHTLTLAARIIQNNNEIDIQGKNHFLNRDAGSFFSRVNGFTNRYTRAITLHDALTFDAEGHELLILATYYDQSVDVEQEFLQSPTLSTNDAEINRTFDVQSDHDQAQFKIDYTYPIEEGSALEVGVDLLALKRKSIRGTEEFIPEVIPYSVVQYDINSETFAAYTTFSKKFLGVNTQAGVRIEQYNRRVEQESSGEQYEYSKLNLFPSIHLDRQLAETQTLKLSYSRRINRPSMNQLRPYLDWSDNVRSFGGNPDLIPAMINSSEIAYSIYGLGKVAVTLEAYYRSTSQHITNGERLNESTGIIEGSPINIKNSTITGFESLIDISATKWLNMAVSGTYFRNGIEGVLFATEIDKKYNGWRARINNSISLPGDIRLNINGFYDSKVLDVQGEVGSDYWVNISLNAPVLNNKGHVSLDVQDILGTSRINRIRAGEDFSSALAMKTPHRIVGISFSYRFNNFRNKEHRFEFED